MTNAVLNSENVPGGVLLPSGEGKLGKKSGTYIQLEFQSEAITKNQQRV